MTAPVSYLLLSRPYDLSNYIGIVLQNGAAIPRSKYPQKGGEDQKRGTLSCFFYSKLQTKPPYEGIKARMSFRNPVEPSYLVTVMAQE